MSFNEARSYAIPSVLMDQQILNFTINLYYLKYTSMEIRKPTNIKAPVTITTKARCYTAKIRQRSQIKMANKNK